MNALLKTIALKFPAVREVQNHIHTLTQANHALHAEIGRLHEVIAAASNQQPSGAAVSPLTDRLLAHPVERLPEVKLSAVPSAALPHRIETAERLICAYHKSLADEKSSFMKRDGEDLWTGLLRTELPALMQSVESKDAVALAHFLAKFGDSFVWFGGITTCVDGYNRDLSPPAVALTYWDKLVALAEYLGVLRMESPENGPWGDNLHIPPGEVVALIENEIKISIAPPLGIIHTDGIQTNRGIYHYRHINSLYSALRANSLAKKGSAVCELGGGIGLTAMYTQRLGKRPYTILDLPITCLLAGHFLIQALPEGSVRLYGEQEETGNIHILPYWHCLALEDKNFDLILNQDSLPEIDDALVMQFLSEIKRIGQGKFLSINHECFHPRTVRNFVAESGGFTSIYRNRCWTREGYLEEFFHF